MKYIAVVLLLQGGEKFAEIEYPDALESEDACIEYGRGVAESFMSSYQTSDNIDHNNLPMIQLRCREDD